LGAPFRPEAPPGAGPNGRCDTCAVQARANFGSKGMLRFFRRAGGTPFHTTQTNAVECPRTVSLRIFKGAGLDAPLARTIRKHVPEILVTKQALLPPCFRPSLQPRFPLGRVRRNWLRSRLFVVQPLHANARVPILVSGINVRYSAGKPAIHLLVSRDLHRRQHRELYSFPTVTRSAVAKRTPPTEISIDRTMRSPPKSCPKR
jgi:hypothetical protein